jgi:hypothetical protein
MNLIFFKMSEPGGECCCAHCNKSRVQFDSAAKLNIQASSPVFADSHLIPDDALRFLF